MGKKGPLIVALIIGILYPLVGFFTIYIVLSRDPGFSEGFWKGVKAATASKSQAVTTEGGLTEFEMQHGIGPIKKEVNVGPIDEALAKQGAAYFKQKCSACHKLDQRYVGPKLRGVTTFRSPAYVMNMILNPREMVQKHPVAKGLLAQYYTVMSPQGVNEEIARAILEYLRWDFEQSIK